MHTPRRSKAKQPPPRAFQVRLNCILQERDGWTEEDLWKSRQMLDVLDRILGDLLRVPGVKTAFPETERLGSHAHSAFLLCRNALFYTREAIAQEIEKLTGERPR